MDKQNQHKEIKKFWLWLEKNDALIRRTLEEGSEQKKKELSNYFDEKILSFGHFTWEINEGLKRKYQLIISPNREFELLKLSKKIISQAPEMDFWEFKYAKEKVRYIEPFKVYDSKLDPHIIDPAAWLFKENGTLFQIKTSSIIDIDEETEQHVFDLVCTAVLGEEYRILNIKKLEKVELTDESFCTLA